MKWPWVRRSRLVEAHDRRLHLLKKVNALHARAGIAEGWVVGDEYTERQIREFFPDYRLPSEKGCSSPGAES